MYPGRNVSGSKSGPDNGVHLTPTRPLGEDRRLRTLRRVEVSQVCDRGTGKWFFLPANATPDAERIYRTVHLTLPRNAVPVPPPEELRPRR